jgi:hypothetical protein
MGTIRPVEVEAGLDGWIVLGWTAKDKHKIVANALLDSRRTNEFMASPDLPPALTHLEANRGILWRGVMCAVAAEHALVSIKEMRFIPTARH